MSKRSASTARPQEEPAGTDRPRFGFGAGQGACYWHGVGGFESNIIIINCTLATFGCYTILGTPRTQTSSFWCGAMVALLETGGGWCAGVRHAKFLSRARCFSIFLCAQLLKSLGRRFATTRRPSLRGYKGFGRW